MGERHIPVDTGLLIALLNPAISVILACGFFGLWLYQKQQRYLLALALGYSCSVGGFVLQCLTLEPQFTTARLLANVCVAVAACLIAGAILVRYGGRRSVLAVCTLAVAGITALSWFLFVHPDLTWRILSINFALGGISLVVAAELLAFRQKRLPEKALFVIALLVSLNFIARPLAIIGFGGPFVSYSGPFTSLYWTTALLSHALFSLLIALCLFTSAAMDMMATLRKDSHTDPLSRLLNRRGFEQRAQELLAFCAKGDFPIALILADLDHFKSINDQYGHATGDRVIAAFASKLQSAAAGARGVAGRIGGEEFAVLLPWTDLAAARLLAEAVRVLFSTGDTDGFPSGLRVTASFGVAARAGDEHLETLMRRADEALYKAKQNGRNSVRMSYERPAEFSSGAFAHR